MHPKKHIVQLCQPPQKTQKVEDNHRMLVSVYQKHNHTSAGTNVHVSSHASMFAHAMHMCFSRGPILKPPP